MIPEKGYVGNSLIGGLTLEVFPVTPAHPSLADDSPLVDRSLQCDILQVAYSNLPYCFNGIFFPEYEVDFVDVDGITVISSQGEDDEQEHR